MTLLDVETVAGASAVTSIIVQLLKSWVPRKWLPHTGVAAGVVIVLTASMILGQTSAQSLGSAVLTGLLAGAAAVGLQRVQKA